MFAAAISRSHNAGLTVYHIESGKLAGIGAEAYGWNNVSLFAENLAGNSTLGGTYKITSATDIQGHAYGGTVIITKSAPDTYRLAWQLGSTEYWGTGYVLKGNLWVAWSKDKEARMVLFTPVSESDPTNFKRLLLSETGEAPVELPPVTRVKSTTKEPEAEAEPEKKADKKPEIKKPSNKPKK
jgi:hypothetical protein